MCDPMKTFCSPSALSCEEKVLEANHHSAKAFWDEALKADSLLAWFIFNVTLTRKDYEQ